jgi:hypothetical protein
MQSFRSTSVHKLREKASLIFSGYGFEAEWFLNEFNRASVPELQQALGLKNVARKGKKYGLFPPILYPGLCTDKKSDIFLAPAIINVSNTTYPLH